MIYSNKNIFDKLDEKNIEILNFSKDCMRSSSYLLRIDDKLLKMKKSDYVIDTKSTNTSSFFDEVIMDDSGLVINPGEFYLGSSVEKISLDTTVCGELFQLSCYARVGLNINFSSCHIAATFGIGRPSAITFEITNNSPNKIKIYPGVKLCHLRFHQQLTSSTLSYTGIYAEKDEAMASNFELKPAR
ncbi:2'-deoxycytidine 5'-triphosphate deaminase [Rouxiella badensis]|uniref:dCTP deaminase n=1 Tax=Rouxiella badensis TaxID=1646377 RepID=UPI001D1477CA|nr:2'-deoxycytidine 5'-triphosphate deaminase [Rouxiella badensis]MCC3705558.1 2'-deoxycytidine 5'-triphosphate deaminase [Rouxiella badensis]